MADQSGLIISSADVQVWVNLGNGAIIQLFTAQNFSGSIEKSVNEIYAISSETPISVKGINKAYSGSFVIQSGEWNRLINSYNGIATTLRPSLTDIPEGLTVTIMFSNRADLTPTDTTLTYTGAQFSNDSFEVNANDPQTLVTLNFRATELTRQVIPIAI